MNILIVNPYSLLLRGNNRNNPCIPYGPLFIATVLKMNGYRVLLFDRNVESRDFSETLSSFKPDVVGFSVLTGETLRDAITMSKQVRARNGNTPVVWGGVHPTLLPFQTIVAPYIDYIVVGEGEHTFLELLRHLEDKTDIGAIPGVCYLGKEDGKPAYTGDRPFIDNLDTLPDPDWELLNIPAYTINITLNTSRGCPHRCTFCYNQKFNKGRRSEFSAPRMVGWMEYFHQKHGIRHFNMMEDNFTFNRKRLDAFLELMILRKMNVTWECESRIAGMSKELFVKMKQAGCVYLNFGVESGSPRMLRFLKKDITVDNVVTVIEWCHDAGIHPKINLMFGLPDETDEDIEMSFDLIRKCKPFHVVANAYRPFPGTELFDYCIEHDLFSMPRTPEEWVDISDVDAFKHSLKGTDERRLEKIMRRFAQLNMRMHRSRKIKDIIFNRPAELLRPKNYIKLIKKLSPSRTY